MKEWFSVKHPLIKLSFIDALNPYKAESMFLDNNGDDDSMANPGRAPILRTKSVTKKLIKNALQKYRYRAGFEPRRPGRNVTP